ncbi:zinc/manganese transport system substrate-binding protein/manganese/iron transport system substrate-binding protein [Streptosporangium lutulentum]|uniref:Zinc/manganese transport system substrate-binding protein/manganese/iron transport system substrate-binding protein n=1 Tax=Streptosporangium lutulentum TaxID=1461250 RepID=A0ABT9Q5Y9_9ACTN|nr:metal ABC transporter substrate-binding protein [Streptosporangium lutulentum]MDP9842077.1 zinc/manganese transport system substrate-binding protein/manganese/iron transport system substrate-binding protein [Streptosporangium lutulentum]
MFSSRSGLAASAGLIALLATACGQAGAAQTSSAASGQVATSAAADGPLKVVATTTQVGDFARNIGGDKVSVTQILRPNVDPHDYEPSPADIQAIADADIVVKNGVGLEKWLDQVISSAGFEGQVVDASQGVTIRKGDGSEEESAGDPHIWHNPQNAKIMAANIEKALAAKDAPDATAYQANLDSYDAKLDALDADIAKRIDTIPADRRKLVTNHDAFGYYIDRYHLTFIGSIIPSFDTSAELSAKQISNLVAKIKSTGVTAVFSESSLPPKTAQAIGTEAGVKVEAGEDSLYGDTLGPEGSAGATYLDMEKHNTDVIVGALNG